MEVGRARRADVGVHGRRGGADGRVFVITASARLSIAGDRSAAADLRLNPRTAAGGVRGGARHPGAQRRVPRRPSASSKRAGRRRWRCGRVRAQAWPSAPGSDAARPGRGLAGFQLLRHGARSATSLHRGGTFRDGC
jgi:hypothetical protein